MSKFPSYETFKTSRTKPHLEIEKHVPDLSCSYLINYNILPKKTKDVYIYDIVGQKFADFYLNNGKLFLGYTDKYITRMIKNFLKHTINSYSKGIFTYRLISLVMKITRNRFKYVSVARNDIEVFERVVNFFKPSDVIVNSEYLKSLINNTYTHSHSRKLFFIEPHDEVFNIDYTFLFYLHRVNLLAKSELKHFKCKFCSVLPMNNFFNQKVLDRSYLFKNTVILSLSRMGFRFKYFSLLKGMKLDALIIGISNGYTILLHNYEKLRFFDISEFESMVCYYHILRERGLISRKESELKRNVTKTFAKFHKLGVIKKLSPYGILVKHGKFSNENLIREGIFTVGDTIYFSFSHGINDFLRLKKKLGSLFFNE